MPRIKAYKGAGKIIPIDEAKVATAFRCPWTARIFGGKREYVAHLRDLREKRMHRRARGAVRQRRLEALWDQDGFDLICKWIELNPDFMFETAVQNGRNDAAERHRDDFWVRITYLDLLWTDSASNSHACPRGGVTNWGGRRVDRDGNPAPRGYPGWTGRIEYQLSHSLGFGSDIMRGLGIHTGSGGGTKDNRHGYGVTFFESDWPGLARIATHGRLSDDHAWKQVKYGTPRYFR